MVWVKVCGLRTRHDVEVAIDAGADAIGLVLADSPRRISPEVARTLADHAAGVQVVLVTVDASATEILDLAGFIGADSVQLHGSNADSAGRAAAQAGLGVFRPVAVADSIDASRIPTSQKVLFDTADLSLHGGTGRSFDWSLTVDVGRPFVLAGGLGPDNVAAAVRAVQPWGVDASSFLECSPGVKDHDAVRRYVQEAKAP
jgi:phosphoribosylanthranilate isomerase